MGLHLWHHIKEYLLKINLFKSSSSTEQTLATEKLATHIFLFAFPCFLLIIAIATAFVIRTTYKAEYVPSSTRFQHLAQKYSTTLDCPCSNIGVSYEKFVSTYVSFHQVCSSQFITRSWIDAIFEQNHIFSSKYVEFHNTLSFFWQTIADLCSISNKTWIQVTSSYGSLYILSPKAVSKNYILQQAYSDLRTHIASAQATFSRNLLAIRGTIAGNQFASALGTNFYLDYAMSNLESWNSLRMVPRVVDDCSCTNVTGCPQPATINNTQGDILIVPGMIIDCLLVDGTLASTLECYYNQSCLSLLHGSLSINVAPLSNTVNVQFSSNSTVQSLVEQLMINDLKIDIAFDLFYNYCRPLVCYYYYSNRFDVIFILTTIAGVFSILSSVLRFCAVVCAKARLRYS
ncbi:unnamed protein product, partial [Rotaria sp. Silwood2]